MLNPVRITFAFLTGCFLSLTAHALTLEAEGRAPIIDQDIVSARQAAIEDASQQAAMQAAVYVSSEQVIRDGILEIDNMQVKTLGRVSNIELLDERVEGTFLKVIIRAEVDSNPGCSNGQPSSYRTTVALTGFPFQHPQQAGLGKLDDMPSALPARLQRLINAQSSQHAINATHITFIQSPQAGLVTAIDTDRLASLQHQLNAPSLNFVVSGVISDLSMLDPRTLSEDNYFIDLYNRLDYKSRKHLRNFQLNLFIHDAFNGALIWQHSFQTAGLWNLPENAKVGFDNQGFLQQEYGRKVEQLLTQAATEISKAIQCQPFKARIVEAEGNTIWLSAGQAEGVKIGDRLTVYRQDSRFFAGTTQQRITSTKQNLTIRQVNPDSAMGVISGDVRQHNIRPGDLAIAD